MDVLTQHSCEQLIAALCNEYEYFIQDDFDPDEDMSAEECLECIKSLPLERTSGEE